MRVSITKGGIFLLFVAAVLSLAASQSEATPAGLLEWQPCAEPQLAGLDCAVLAVPKAYGKQGLGTIPLAVIRAKATGLPGERIGSLFFNPGGPGGPGYEALPVLVRDIPAELRKVFDIVSWDPRGVGRSTGLDDCGNGSYGLPATGSVDWPSVLAEMRRTTRKANLSCWRRHADVAPYVGTVSTARDLDILRAAVGDQKITYWGTSYGTRIGFVYATLFPDRIRAMLLTSPVEPGGTWESFTSGAALSPDVAVGFFFEVKPRAGEHYRRALAALNVRALQLPSGHMFTRWDLRGVLGAMMKSEQSYDAAAKFLRDADVALNGSGDGQAAALKALDAMDWSDRYPVNGGPVAFIGCADYRQRLTPIEQEKLAASFREKAPVAGFSASQGLFYCEGVPAAIDPMPDPLGSEKAPMVIIASTRDGLTQYGWANDAARVFPNSRIVTYVGTQHTPYLGGSACTDRYGTDYLLSLQRPEFDAACPSMFSEVVD